MASYKSGQNRNLDAQLVGKDNPGVGAYNIKEHLSFGNQKIQGGAPNNFLILTKNPDPSIKKMEQKM